LGEQGEQDGSEILEYHAVKKKKMRKPTEGHARQEGEGLLRGEGREGSCPVGH